MCPAPGKVVTKRVRVEKGLSAQSGHWSWTGKRQDLTPHARLIHGLHGSFGPSAVLRVAGIEILVVSIARQILDLQQFKAFGINPQHKNVVALKSMQHFRAAFEPIAGQVIVCDSGALCTPRYDLLPYRNVPRPIFPLDRDMELPTCPGINRVDT